MSEIACELPSLNVNVMVPSTLTSAWSTRVCHRGSFELSVGEWVLVGGCG